MIRFVEMKGIYIDDEIKSFGFYNTVTDTFVGLSNSYIFDSVKEYEMYYNENCNIEKERLDKLIPNSWIEYEKLLSNGD